MQRQLSQNARRALKRKPLNMAKFWGSTHRCPVAAVRSRMGGLHGHSRHRRRGSRSNRVGMTTAGGQLGKGGPQKSIGSQSGQASGIGAEGRNLPQFPTKANSGKASLLRIGQRCPVPSSTTLPSLDHPLGTWDSPSHPNL